MKEKFNDIFETINLMHKKYGSQDYLENLEELKKSSNDLVKILEKYKVTGSNDKLINNSIKKEKKKMRFSKENKNRIPKKEKNLRKIEAM